MLGLWHCGPHDSPLETKDVVRSRLLFREDWVQIGVKQLVQRQRHGYVADRRGMASLSSRAANWWRRCWPNAWPFYPSVDTYNMKSPMIRSFSGWWWLEHGCFFPILGMSSSQLTLTPSFFGGVGSTTKLFSQKGKPMGFPKSDVNFPQYQRDQRNMLGTWTNGR